MSNLILCPLHGDSQEVALFWQFSARAQLYSLYKCEKCDVVFYHPFPIIDYSVHTDSMDAVKDYVQINANVEGLLLSLMKFIPQGSYTSMIEVGCGFGFSLDFAKHILGMKVTGYEPSLYGEIGAKELGINIQRKLLTSDEVKGNRADIIFLSEVLEHIDEPLPFLQLLRSALNENGVLILTTPNYRRLKRDLENPSDLALLSPGAHVILYGQESLELILKKAGFKHVEVQASENSLIAIASGRELQWRNVEEMNDMIRSYYRNVLKRVTSDAITYPGIFYRLFRNYIDFGEYGAADDLLRNKKLPSIPDVAQIAQIANAGDYYQSGASCNSVLAYYLGIQHLNYYGKYEKAAEYFEVCYQLCRKKLEHVPEASVLEYGFVWLARYHQAIALSHSGRHNDSLSVLADITGFAPGEKVKNLPSPTDEMKTMARDLKMKGEQALTKSLEK